MEVASVAVQQASSQTNAGVAMLKKTAQAEQAVVQALTQSSNGARGQLLDITV